MIDLALAWALVKELATAGVSFYRHRQRVSPILAIGRVGYSMIDRNALVNLSVTPESYQQAMIDLIRPAYSKLVWTCHGSPLYEPHERMNGRKVLRHLLWGDWLGTSCLTDHDRAFARAIVRGAGRRKCRLVVFKNDKERQGYLNPTNDQTLHETSSLRRKHFERACRRRCGELWFTGEWILRSANVTDMTLLDIAYVVPVPPFGYLSVSEYSTSSRGAELISILIGRYDTEGLPPSAANLVFAVAHNGGRHNGTQIAWRDANDVPADTADSSLESIAEGQHGG